MPKISVIIPVYNAQKYLHRCLDSVLNQTLTDWEIIAVNDGSPDKSIDILNEYSIRNKKIKIISQKNSGVSIARNNALEKATGDYIFFLDSDDFIHPQTFEILYNFAITNGSDIVSFKKDSNLRAKLLMKQFLKLNTTNVRPNNINKKYNLSKIKSYTTDDVFAIATEKSKTKKDFCIKHCYIWQNLYKSDLIKDFLFYENVPLLEDYIWWSLLLLRLPKTTIINVPLYYYIPQLNSAMASSGNLKMLNFILSNSKYIFDVYKHQSSQTQMKIWQSEFMWPFIGYGVSKIKKLDNNDLISAKKMFKDIKKAGVLKNPSSKSEEKLVLKIQKFIGGK